VYGLDLSEANLDVFLIPEFKEQLGLYLCKTEGTNQEGCVLTDPYNRGIKVGI